MSIGPEVFSNEPSVVQASSDLGRSINEHRPNFSLGSYSFAAMIGGGFIAVLLYNLLLWKSLRQNVFFDFAILCGVYALYLLDVSGLITALANNLDVSRTGNLRVLPFLCISVFFWFCRGYLRLNSSRAHRSLNMTSSVVVLIAGGVSLVSVPVAQILATLGFTLGMGVVFLSALRLRRQGHQDAGFLFLGTLPFAVVVGIGIISPDGNLASRFKEYLPWALAGQVLSIGAGLAGRITKVRERLWNTLAEKTENLEAQVRERTLEYYEANKDLLHQIEVRKVAEQNALEQATLLREAQARLVSTSRLGALGEMATGISHEINNPLTIIKGYLFLIQEGLSRPEIERDRFRSMVEKSLIAADRMASVIRALREFSLQDQVESPSEVSVASSLNTSLSLVRERMVCSAIDVTIRPVPDDLLVWVRPADLSQTIIGCLNNSVDAVKRGSEKWIRIEVLFDETYVTLRIIDSGPGISPSIEDRIFTPFFTTKDPGEGTGMGISIAKQLIRSSGGDLRYVSGEKNTTFEIMLRRVVHETASKSA